MYRSSLPSALSAVCSEFAPVTCLRQTSGRLGGRRAARFGVRQHAAGRVEGHVSVVFVGPEDPAPRVEPIGELPTWAFGLTLLSGTVAAALLVRQEGTYRRPILTFTTSKPAAATKETPVTTR